MSDWIVAMAALAAFHLSSGGAVAQTTQKPNLTTQPTLYVVGYAHLDTEWRWEYPQVVNEYLRKTMGDNFKLFDKYHYVFNFSGANRYRLMKEYFRADFALLKPMWIPAGGFRRDP
jgi:alpha-mannosidase